MPAVRPHVSSPVIVVAAPQPLRRLESSGWFSRGLSGAGGVLVALFIAGAVALALLAASMYGGLEFVRSAGRERSEQIESDMRRLTVEARRLAMPHLRKRGIGELADDAFAHREGNTIVLLSQARDESGKVCKVSVIWEAGTFGGTQQWQLKSVSVDDDVKFFK